MHRWHHGEASEALETTTINMINTSTDRSLGKYYHYVMSGNKTKTPLFKGSRLGGHELCQQLVEEGWELENV